MGDVIKGNWLGGDDSGSIDGGGMDGGGDGGDGVSYEGGLSRRLVSSSLSLSNSTSQQCFLVCLAGGKTGSVDSVTAWAEAVGAMTGDGQAVTVAEVCRWRRRLRLQMFTAVVCVVKRQNRVTS
jgi:hypothetical protein